LRESCTTKSVELAIAQRSLGGTPEGMQAIESARSFTDSTLQTVRDLSHLLHPSLLDDLGLPAAVDWYLKGVGRRHEIRVELLEDGMESRMPPETESAAFRIIQEALTNVVKHAQATTARIYLQRLPNTVLITVEDNGVGFDPESELARTGRGLGLIGIRERAAYLLGTVRLESVVGKGTRLTVELPAPATSQTTDSGDESVRGEPELMS
jgi:signal transduction histidine kinase